MMTFFCLMGTSAVSLFQNERLTQFLRHRASGYHGTLSYMITKTVFDDVMYRLIPCILFSYVSYTLIDYGRVWTEADFYNVTTQTVLAGNDCSTSTLPFERLGACAADQEAALKKSNFQSMKDLEDEMIFFRSLPIYTFSLYLSGTVSSTLCTIIGAMTKDSRTGNFVSVLVLLFFLMFSGALINNQTVKDGLALFSWIRYVSPYGFALESLLIGQMNGQCFYFNPKVALTDTAALVCAEVSGETWLLQLGCTPAGEISSSTNDAVCNYTGQTILYDFYALLIFRYIFLASILYFVLRWKRQ